ncbi:MAG: hypothetical protein KDB01_26255, partial [Planctomycetaceae bacterium]|nr:hypothetical protein [Planctomycetaceae bacterium]
MISLRICLLAAVLMALSVAVVNATPPGKDKLLSNSRDLNAPIDLKTDVDDATKKTVLVYYANETAPDVAEAKNYEKLLEWLGDSKNPTLKRIGESIHGDLEKFHKVVDQELATIKKHVAADSGGKSTSVAIFTNRLTRAGQFQVVEPGIDAVTVIPFAVPRLKGMVYSSNPLSHPVVFRLALAALTRQFDPEKYQFVLITKSHGSEVHVLTPRVGLDISDAEREPLLAQLEKDVANMPDSTIHAVLDP